MVYDTRVNATEAEEFRKMNPLMKARPGGGQIRNLKQAQEKAAELAIAPNHLRKRTPYYHLHPEMDSKKAPMYDPFDYFRNNLTKEEEHAFTTKEEQFS